jgi:hypothetical protein
MKPLRLAVLCSLALSCSSASNPAVALKLQGRLERATPGSQGSPLRLAMAWYPDFGGTSPAAPAGAIVMQEKLTFEGNFPIDFTFEVSGPPPAGALFDLSATGGTGHIGYGVLLAYLDGNGNKTYDPIPRGGAPIDTIVGVSVADPSQPPPPRSHYVVYLDGQPGKDDYWSAFKLKQGYNLIEAHNNFGVEPVPEETSISIPVTGNAALDLYGCPDIFAVPGYLQRSCGIDPYAGGYQAQGAIFSAPTGTQVLMQVYDGAGNVADAALAVDGAALAYDAAGQTYTWWTAARWSGAHTLTLAVPGHATETLPFTLPGPMTVLAPASGATLKRGSSVTISWAATPGTDFYDLYFLANDGSGAWLFHALTNDTAITTPAIAYTGDARLSVKALGPMAVGSQGSFLTPVSQVSVPLTFVP